MTRTEDEEVASYYSSEFSVKVMGGVRGWLGHVRIRQELSGLLNREAMKIADVGGGTGQIARWISRRGHTVYLSDLSPGQVSAACDDNDVEYPVKELIVEDARTLPWPSDYFDLVVLFGPLYHMYDSEQRIQALREAARICRAGGTVIAEGLGQLIPIVNYCSGKNAGLDEERLKPFVESGNWRPVPGSGWDVPAHYAQPHELEAEVRESGLSLKETVAVEGPLWTLQDVQDLPASRGRSSFLVDVATSLRTNRAAVYASPHYLVIATKEHQTEEVRDA